MSDPQSPASASNQAGSAAPLLVALAGPAGSGKSTLCDRLVGAGLGFSRVVTATTRAPRAGERDGVDYHFLSPEAFEQGVAAGRFLEWAWVHGERRYGTPVDSVLGPLGSGQSLVMNLDVQGVASLRRASATNPILRRALVAVFVRIEPTLLVERLRGRGLDNESEIARRLATAEAELKQAETFDHVIDSGTRDADFEALLAIIRSRRTRASKE
jgi:guanylate kinase